MATQEAVMTTKEVANRLHELFQENKWMEAQQELFSDDAESIEPKDSPGMQSVKGIDAIRKKNQWWAENNIVHSAEVDGPFVGDDKFAVYYKYDVTFKPTGQRQPMEEMALYTVKDGKVAREQFFYRTTSS